MSTTISGERAFTNPVPGTPYTNGRSLYRATFGLGDTDDLVGVFTQAGDGLKSVGWVGTSKALGVSSGRVVRSTDTTPAWSVQLPIEGVGAMYSMDVVTLPTTTGLHFDLFRNTLGGSPNGYRARFNADGTVSLVQRVSTVHTLFGSPYPIRPGDRVGIRWVGGSLSLIINGEEKIIASTSDVARVGYCGLAGVAATNGFALDNLAVTTY